MSAELKSNQNIIEKNQNNLNLIKNESFMTENKFKDLQISNEGHVLLCID